MIREHFLMKGNFYYKLELVVMTPRSEILFKIVNKNNLKDDHLVTIQKFILRTYQFLFK